MVNKQELLNLDGKILAIYFPPGLPERGGSCAFASMRCLVNCLSYLTHNNITDKTFRAFQNYDSNKITNIVWDQLKNKKIKLMEWFCWGDCPPDLTEKVVGVIKKLSKKGVVQCGFTRNKELWKAILEVPNTRIGVTLEYPENYDSLDNYAKEGLVAVPQYDTGKTKLFYKTTKTRASTICGSNFMYDEAKQVSYEADCQTCFQNKRGCFTEFKFVDVMNK